MPTYVINVVVNTAGANAAIAGTTARVQGLEQAMARALTVLSAKKVIDLSDAYIVLQNKLRTVTESQFQLAEVTEKTFKIAQENRVAWDGLAQIYSRMRRSTEQLGLSQQETLDVTDTISKAIKLSGATANETRSVLLQ